MVSELVLPPRGRGVMPVPASDLVVTPRQVAAAFASMSDEDQAQVFIEVAAIAAGWDGTNPQWYMVGRHLAICGCSTDDARQLVRDIADGITAGERKLAEAPR